MTGLAQKIITEARGWIGTPYRHQQSARGAGCDCLGLLRGVWRAMYGKEPESVPAYSADWSEPQGDEQLLRAATRHLIAVDVGRSSPGDLLLFRMRPGAVAKHRPALLQAEYDSAGDLLVQWIRRSRIDGDNWSSVEVPLGEASESYLLRVMQGGAMVRESSPSVASWTYSQTEKISDGLSGSYAIEVAQLSERFGAGPFKRIEIDG